MNKTILVTGASRGIGRAIAHAFADCGYHVFLNCNSSVKQLREVQQEIEAQYPGAATCVPGNIGNPNDVRNIFKSIYNECNALDVLVNNAGSSYIGVLTDMSSEDWQNILSTNLTSVFNSCRLTVPGMVHRHSGKIINISSVWGCCGASCEVAYSATKGGINAFTQALAKELAPSNIQVNAIACGAIDTEMNAFLSEEDRQALTDEIPSGRFGRPEEVAELVLDLSENHHYMTGQIIRLDGGWI